GGGVRGTAGVVPRWIGGVRGTAGVVPRWIGGGRGTAGGVPRGGGGPGGGGGGGGGRGGRAARPGVDRETRREELAADRGGAAGTGPARPQPGSAWPPRPRALRHPRPGPDHRPAGRT